MSDIFDHHNDAMESLIDGRDAEEPRFYRQSRTAIVTCRYCGKGPLRWKTSEVGWRLYDRDAIHLCAEYARHKAARKALEEEEEEDDYALDQWWFQELTAIHGVQTLTMDQYRAIQVAIKMARKMLPKTLEDDDDR